MSRSVVKEDTYATWDFLKCEADKVEGLSYRPQRRPSPEISQRLRLNLMGIEESRMNDQAMESPVEPPSTERSRSCQKADHFRSLEEMGNGKWEEVLDKEHAMMAPFHQKPYSPTKRRGYAIGQTRQDELQDYLKTKSGQDQYQVMPISEMSPNLKFGGRRHLRSPRSFVRGSDFLYNYNDPRAGPPPLPPLPPATNTHFVEPSPRPPPAKVAFSTPRLKVDQEAVVVKHREEQDRQVEEKLALRRAYALERKREQEEKQPNVLLLGLQPDNMAGRTSKKSVEQKQPLITNRDDKLFGPSMRRIQPPQSDETVEDVAKRRGLRHFDSKHEAPIVHPPHRSDNRPPTMLGRFYTIDGVKKESAVQKWSVNQLYAAGAQNGAVMEASHE